MSRAAQSDGYQYLTRQVASSDAQRSAFDPLVAYYTLEGNPPGQWAGSGIAELGVSGTVSEEQMAALFGEGLHPNAQALIAERVAAGMAFERRGPRCGWGAGSPTTTTTSRRQADPSRLRAVRT